MLSFQSSRSPAACGGITRRDFLRVGSLAAGSWGLSLADKLRSSSRSEVRCILLFLVGGPSQIDTWDPKPEAAEGVRGPFRAIRTNVPGIRISEHFPSMAAMADRYAIVRSVHHTAAPIHETGMQLMQTGRLDGGGLEHPHFGAALSYVRGPGGRCLPPFVVLPVPIGSTGVHTSHGQGAGYLGRDHEPCAPPCTNSPIDPARSDPRALLRAVDSLQRSFESRRQGIGEAIAHALDQLFASERKRALDLTEEHCKVRTRYGWNTFGQSCLLARRLVERGVRLVTVNMFDTVFNQVTWDCHADGLTLPATLDDYRDFLCPMFDQAYTALLGDLWDRGLLGDTLVLAMGEFGRTPQINPRGGRDHWTRVWSVLFAGGGILGGQVVGASDHLGAEPRDRPVGPGEIAATVYSALGLDLQTGLPGPAGRRIRLADGQPIKELLRCRVGRTASTGAGG